MNLGEDYVIQAEIHDNHIINEHLVKIIITVSIHYIFRNYIQLLPEFIMMQ